MLCYCQISFSNKLLSQWTWACGCSETTTALQDIWKDISSRAWFQSYQDTLSSYNISKKLKRKNLVDWSSFLWISLLSCCTSLNLGWKLWKARELAIWSFLPQLSVLIVCASSCTQSHYHYLLSELVQQKFVQWVLGQACRWQRPKFSEWLNMFSVF